MSTDMEASSAMKQWLDEAYKEAQLGLAEGGLPIGRCWTHRQIQTRHSLVVLTEHCSGTIAQSNDLAQRAQDFYQ